MVNNLGYLQFRGENLCCEAFINNFGYNMTKTQNVILYSVMSYLAEESENLLTTSYT